MSGRNEDILRSMIDGTSYTKEPKSRNEELLLELKDVIEAGGLDPDNYYTKDETDYEITEKVAEIVADAPEDFDTLKEMSDWIAGHEDSAAAMNSQIQANTLAIAGKVDKVTGKGLSTEDYTSAEKSKLAGLSNYDDTALQTAVANKVDKVSGKELSTEDYTTAEKTKLSGIETGANKTIVDSALSSSSTNPVQNKIINSALNNKIPKNGDTSLSGTFEPNLNYGANLGSTSYRFDKIYGKDLYLTNALSVANGGTGCTTLSDFKTALGLGNSAYKGYTTSVTSGSTDLITSGAVYSGLANYIPLAGSSAITGDLVPSASDSIDLGSSSKRWDNLYAKNVSAESFSINVRTYDCDTAIESGHYIFYGGGRTSNLPSTAGDSEYGILVVYRSGDYCIQTVYMLGKKTAHIRYNTKMGTNPFTSWVQIFSFSS